MLTNQARKLLQSAVVWNTGRLYSEQGQRMAAVRLPDGRVMFSDYDRYIDGVTNAPCTNTDANDVRAFAMSEYDHGRYLGVHGLNLADVIEYEFQDAMRRIAKEQAALAVDAHEAIESGADFCIASYYTDGKPATATKADKARRTAIGVSVAGYGRLVSLPAQLNGRRIPELDEVAAILRGDSVAAAMAAFVHEIQQQAATEGAAARTNGADIDKDCPYFDGVRLLAGLAWCRAWHAQAIADSGYGPALAAVVADGAQVMNVEHLDYAPINNSFDCYCLVAYADGIYIEHTDMQGVRLVCVTSSSWIAAADVSDELPPPPSVVYVDLAALPAQQACGACIFLAGELVEPCDECRAKLPQFRNMYKCPRCAHEWDDVWPAQCDDDCPNCGARHISPYDSEDA